MPAGRPSTYTKEKAHEICSLIAQGLSVIKIAQRDDMPEERTIYLWLSRHEEFVQEYARAREQQADVYSQEIVDIADSATPEDYMVAKLRADARKWAASKLAPKKYGDRMALAGDEKAPLTVNIASRHDDI